MQFELSSFVCSVIHLGHRISRVRGGREFITNKLLSFMVDVIREYLWYDSLINELLMTAISTPSSMKIMDFGATEEIVA